MVTFVHRAVHRRCSPLVCCPRVRCRRQRVPQCSTHLTEVGCTLYQRRQLHVLAPRKVVALEDGVPQQHVAAACGHHLLRRHFPVATAIALRRLCGVPHPCCNAAPRYSYITAAQPLDRALPVGGCGCGWRSGGGGSGGEGRVLLLLQQAPGMPSTTRSIRCVWASAKAAVWHASAPSPCGGGCPASAASVHSPTHLVRGFHTRCPRSAAPRLEYVQVLPVASSLW
jgi:hypothetical protein